MRHREGFQTPLVCFTTNTLKYACIVLVVHSVTQSLPILRTHFEKSYIQPDSSWRSHLGHKLCDHHPATVFQCLILEREAMFFEVKQWLHSFRPGREGWRRTANGYLMLPLVAFHYIKVSMLFSNSYYPKDRI